MTQPLTLLAPAKINLALHVTGQRADGYHLLDSLVAFTEIGDRITVERAEEDGFTLSGPYAAGLPNHGDNLVLKARDSLRTALGHAMSAVHIHLEKNLPIASGIGGGSADAAAVLKGLIHLWQADIADDTLHALALSLGADVPMCLVSRPLIARGIGEEIQQIALPAMPILLVNPLVPVSTPRIFKLLTNKNNPPLPPGLSARGGLERLAALRNDLQPPAEALEPVIAAICGELAEAGAVVTRMSGSGATCFGLFTNDDARDRAAHRFRSRYPGWFIAASRTLD